MPAFCSAATIVSFSPTVTLRLSSGTATSKAAAAGFYLAVEILLMQLLRAETASLSRFVNPRHKTLRAANVQVAGGGVRRQEFLRADPAVFIADMQLNLSA
ncbi:Uncharacterised protein (plasmid) [Klebsiella aerogenes]|nr:Uncharacterised protein [Klebsiella aerogenes]